MFLRRERGRYLFPHLPSVTRAARPEKGCIPHWEKGDSDISTMDDVVACKKGDSGMSTIHDNDEMSRDTPQSPFSRYPFRTVRKGGTATCPR
jgi:hypothetical protein